MSTRTDYATPSRRAYCRDRYAAQRAAAIAWLGLRWRGLPGCVHTYIPAAERRLKQEGRT